MMSQNPAETVALVSPNLPIHEAVLSMDRVAKAGGEPGICIIVDPSKKVLGVVTDGDIRLALGQRADFSKPIETIMSRRFIFALSDMPRTEQLRSVQKQIGKLKRLNDPRLTKVVICNPDMTFDSVANLLELYKFGEITTRSVAVYGMGYVGLTLALTVAELKQFEIVGLDINGELIKNLKKGIPPFRENGLDSLLEYCLKNKAITFKDSTEDFNADIHIITVGTPIDENNQPSLSHLTAAGEAIGSKLKQGDLVICRSTVPIGTTRNILIPLLESLSSLKAGKDFFIAFAPERTLAGSALKELKTIPQIIGGFSDQCRDLAMSFFQKFNPAIVQMPSLEASEIIKLVNNTFRDTVFSFANEIALICDRYNINSYELITAASEGYPRNRLPLPSPGVGGSCLTKDPFLYAYPNGKRDEELVFGPVSRKVNEKMPKYIVNQYIDFLSSHGKDVKDWEVLMVGLAFKGLPETSDVRDSSALAILKILRQVGVNKIYGFDAVLSRSQIEALELTPISVEEGLKKTHAVFFMNNHPKNTEFNVFRTLQTCPKPLFFFDGWNMFNRFEIESIDQVQYATLGYRTPAKQESVVSHERI